MRSWPVLTAVFLAPVIASAQTAVGPPPARDVVVTGHRLADTEAALKACLVRHCPPNEDIDATLAHAENLFVAGNYVDARRTVMASLGRNKHLAKTYPVPVSDLWRAESRLSVHLGEADAYRIGAIESLGALKAGLPADDPRVLGQQLEVADAFAHLGRLDGAVQMYDAVARRAHALGRRKTEAYVQLKKAMLYTAVSAGDPTYRPVARHEIAALSRLEGGDLASYRQTAAVLSAELTIGADDKAGVDKLVAASKLSATDRPSLLYAPPIDEQANLRAFESGDVNGKMPVDDFEDQWADVSFWIKPDGTVSDADLLRGSKTLDRNWLGPVLSSITGRRYAPLKLAADDPGLLRVERYTRTAHLITLTGSRLRTREAYPRIEMVDLTQEPAGKPGG
jgi:hypothetical protein